MKQDSTNMLNTTTQIATPTAQHHLPIDDANSCTITLPEGTYVGGFTEKKNTKVPHGYGVCIFNGGRYEGEFQDGVRCGRGQLIYSNGNVYEGQFKDNKKHGHGTFTWAKGEKYVGEFANDLRNGFGTFTWTSGNKYVGQFVNDMRCGTGIFTWPDGEVYEGQFENDSRTGFGCYKYVNGDRYEGDFLKGLRHGTGVYYYKNGDRYNGEFFEGKREGRGVLCFHNGNKYEGWFKDDKRHGRGIFYWASGSRYEGNFVSDQRTGHGIYYYFNGEKYEGYFKAGKKDGPGFFFAKDGTVAKELWREGTNISKQLLSADEIQYEREAVSIACEIPGTTKIGNYILTNRLLLRIFSFLDAESLCRASQVNKTWKRLCDTEELWKGLCVKRWQEVSSITVKPIMKIWKPLYKWRTIFINTNKPDGRVPFGTLVWENGNMYIGHLRPDSSDFAKKLLLKGSSDQIESKYEGKLTHMIFDEESRKTRSGSGKQSLSMEKEGNGALIYNNGDVYFGEWKNGKKDGQGTEVWSSGTRYEGQWKDGKRHGKGSMFYANGDTYVGEFVYNAKHGRGTYFVAASGVAYEGEWKDGNRHGNGAETDSSGVISTGQWVDGVKVETNPPLDIKPDYEDRGLSESRLQQWNARRRYKQKLKARGKRK